MLNRLMTSRRVRGILLTVVLLSAVVAILSVAIPLNRKRDAVTSLGEQSLSEASSLAMSMEYYNGLRIQSLLDYPSETVFYQNLCGFLSRAKQTLSYDRAYILYQGLEGRIAYLADADYARDLQAGVDYHAIGEEYTDERYTRRCISILQEQFEGRRKETYVPDILDDSYIITYLPLRNADGEVMAVLGVDAKLGYSDFAQYGPINFERLTSISALLFLLSLVLFVLCMDKGLSEEEKEKADLRAMDEELVANLVRGRFLSGIIVDESEKDADSKAENPDGNTEDGNIEEAKESETEEEQPKKKNNIRVPYVNNQNGEMYQAIFTDGYELQRFDPKKRLRPVVVKFDDLEKFLVKDAKGFLLNPTSTALPLRREQLPAFKKRIDG